MSAEVPDGPRSQACRGSGEPSLRCEVPSALRIVWLCALLALVGAIRLRLLEVPFERDEGEYAYGAQRLLAGEAPFRGLYNMKLPGAQMAYALAMAAFGQSVAGARMGLLIATTATTLLVYRLARRLLGDLPALAAATAQAVLSVGTAMLGPFGHATHFVALAGSGGLLALLRARADGSGAWTFASGLLFGLAILMKQPGAVFVLFAVAGLSARAFASGAPLWQRGMTDVSILAAGACLPLAIVLAWIAVGGSFETFWTWVVGYGTSYASEVALGDGLENLRLTAAGILSEAPLLWGLAGLGLAASLWPRSGVGPRAFLLGLTAFSFLGVCPGLYFRGHYFLLALPACSLLVGAGVRWLAEAGLRRGVGLPQRTAGLLTLVALAAGMALVGQREPLFRLGPTELLRALYDENPFPESVEVARYVREHTSPAESIAVFGSEPQIYFYAQRRAATGQIYMYPLMEPQPRALAMQEQLIREVEAARPAFVIWVKSSTSWLERPDSVPRIFDWTDAYLRPRYDVVGQVGIREPASWFLWDAAAAAVPVGPETSIVVLERRQEPARASARF